MSTIPVKFIDVCLSPDLIHLYPLEDRAVVVVDILRATSCMVTALAHGIASIKPVSHLDECRAFKIREHIISGERNGEKVDGFDLGNSPFEYMSEELKGKKIAFTTTNGTLAIDKARHAREVIIGSFLNLTAVANYLRSQENHVLILCAGWKGKVNLEDTLFAGALVRMLADDYTPECDAPRMALHLYEKARHDLRSFLKDSSHVRRLKRLHIEKDIAFCLEFDRYDVVPVLREGVLVNQSPPDSYRVASRQSSGASQ